MVLYSQYVPLGKAFLLAYASKLDDDWLVDVGDPAL
jgi:hypothetical protein